MTHLVDDTLNHLSEEHKELLQQFNQGWTRHQKQSNQVQRHSMALDVKELYTRAGLNRPAVIVCDSIFQLTVYPVIISLMLDQNNSDHVIPLLRKSLQMPPWGRLWENLDAQLKPKHLENLRIQSDKLTQQNSQKELNRLIHRIYETVGGTVDTHDAPRLTPIGLQINSNFHATVKSLLASLEKDIGSQVSDSAMERARQRLELITNMYARMESQLDLQLLPQILARTVNTFKTILNNQRLDTSSNAGSEARQRLQPSSNSGSEAKQNEQSESTDKFSSAEQNEAAKYSDAQPSEATKYSNAERSDAEKLSNAERGEIFSLINQAQGNDDVTQAGRPLGAVQWTGPRMGAYRDPAIRLISSDLQLELFKRSQLMRNFPLHFFLRDIAHDTYSAPNLESLNIWSRLLERAYALLFYEGIAFVCEYPVHSCLDEEHRFHDETGPALKFADEFSAHFWHGRRVTRDTIESPATITVEQIEKEKNVETRSILVERYGLERFIIDSGAKKIHEDECGVLYHKVFTSSDSLTDEPLVVVMVDNSTPEPDGTRQRFFLRVPPNVRTAREAVAWTFGLDEDDYNPAIES
ncbi:MAG: hypothetical protein SGJ27_14170 [Candidatus Melainabacteria bacterium]|nr:hypothetical protein [Candidatus Melainabacteria bacterium]